MRERQRRKGWDSHHVAINLLNSYFLTFLSLEADTEVLQAERQLAPLRANAQTAGLVYSADCFPRLTAGVENFRHYTFFERPHISIDAIHVALPVSLVYLKTQLHILFFKFIQLGLLICNSQSNTIRMCRLRE